VCACVCVCVRACVRACVRVRVFVCVYLLITPSQRASSPCGHLSRHGLAFAPPAARSSATLSTLSGAVSPPRPETGSSIRRWRWKRGDHFRRPLQLNYSSPRAETGSSIRHTIMRDTFESSAFRSPSAPPYAIRTSPHAARRTLSGRLGTRRRRGPWRRARDVTPHASRRAGPEALQAFGAGGAGCTWSRRA
jgi:hypothetical protein